MCLDTCLDPRFIFLERQYIFVDFIVLFVLIYAVGQLPRDLILYS